MAQRAANPPAHLPVAAEEAGRRGEQLFADAAACTVFRNLRLRERDGRRFEIDAVCVSARLLCVVEVKNWSGEVHMQPDGRWQQQRRSGETVDHGDVLGILEHKAALLARVLETEGVVLPSEAIVPRVVLINTRCKLERGLEEHSLVVHTAMGLEQLVSTLHTDHMQTVLDAVLPWRWSSVIDQSSVCRALASLPTWDVLCLHGGKTVEGTLVEVQGLSLIHI
eukprot:TRINITY_DN19192_c0_g1_i1.p1 TRINITY_DN19192_c0_g1~~TRINITY_DN19192_c0_g1_i1.p1  ORF type:complete len:223 (+),score=66.71 TRINITY_DN19192_c0_g1_i1:114-782(+)